MCRIVTVIDSFCLNFYRKQKHKKRENGQYGCGSREVESSEAHSGLFLPGEFCVPMVSTERFILVQN